MIDDELIASLEYHGGKVWPGEQLSRLIALARIGNRVTQLPREIYEAANAIANLDGDWEGNSCDG